MIPDPTPADLARDAEQDYATSPNEWCSAWIRRCEHERKLKEAAEQRVIDPYPNDVAAAGLKAPKCEQIVTIQHRWGNTAIKYRVSWGGSALWVEDGHKQEIERLKKKCDSLSKKVKKMKGGVA